MDAISLSDRTRRRCCLSLSLVSWFFALFGVGCATLGGFLKFSLAQYANIAGDHDCNLVPCYLILAGIIVAFVHTTGGVVLRTVNNPDRREKYTRAFKMLNILYTSMALIFLSSAVYAYIRVGGLEDTIKAGITSAMGLYHGELYYKYHIYINVELQ